jgi:hypothetical protein
MIRKLFVTNDSNHNSETRAGCCFLRAWRAVFRPCRTKMSGEAVPSLDPRALSVRSHTSHRQLLQLHNADQQLTDLFSGQSKLAVDASLNFLPAPLRRITVSRGDPSTNRHRRNARDTRSLSGGLPQCQVEEPSTWDTECPDPMRRRGAERRRPKVKDPPHRCYLPVARAFGRQ